MNPRSGQELFAIIDKSIRSGAKKARMRHERQNIINRLKDISISIEKVDSSDKDIDTAAIRLEILSLLEEAVCLLNFEPNPYQHPL